MLVDLHLGADTGFDVLRDLRHIPRPIRSFVVTGNHTVSNTVEAIRLGAEDVIAKPFSLTEIVARITRHPLAQGVADVATPSLDYVIYNHVNRVLADCAGNRSEAARRLKKPRSWLRRFLDRPAPTE